MAVAAEKLKRHTVPAIVLAASKVRAPGKAIAAARRAAGKRATVELFVAFDDPSSCLAILELDRRLAARDVDLVIRPVINRDMDGDPAIEAKRSYALLDAGRLARRYGLTITRDAPIAASDVAFAAEWAAAAGPLVARDFCVSVAKRLWFEPDANIDRDSIAETFGLTVGGVPPMGGAAAVVTNEKLMKRRGAYTVPMAAVHGRLFFAHERLDQICEELDLLGWKSR